MKYIDSFRDPKLIKGLLEAIQKSNDPSTTFKFMEVCGTHTMSIARYGINSILPENIQLVSGPGCPVCVTPVKYVEEALALARMEDVIITSFGDMLKVPGAEDSLYILRSQGHGIRIVYSPADSIKIAEENPDKKIVFLAVGFETTTPTIAGTLAIAEKKEIENFFILAGNKVMPPAMSALAASGDLKLDGFICPPHVSAITGTGIYEFLAEDYSKACVVAGFEPTDILQSVLMLIEQVKNSEAKVENQYSRVVTREGNLKAQSTINEFFTPVDSAWRGIGVIPQSGLTLKKEYAHRDAQIEFGLDVGEVPENPNCICGDVLTGRKIPTDCKLFARACTPAKPQGACMVSSEGSCAAFYKYRIND